MQLSPLLIDLFPTHTHTHSLSTSLLLLAYSLAFITPDIPANARRAGTNLPGRGAAREASDLFGGACLPVPPAPRSPLLPRG
eukprot:3835511-Rhodomonas_salina.2